MYRPPRKKIGGCFFRERAPQTITAYSVAVELSFDAEMLSFVQLQPVYAAADYLINLQHSHVVWSANDRFQIAYLLDCICLMDKLGHSLLSRAL